MNFSDVHGYSMNGKKFYSTSLLFFPLRHGSVLFLVCLQYSTCIYIYIHIFIQLNKRMYVCIQISTILFETRWVH